MALVHADNFSIYGTNSSLMLNGVYAAIGSFALDTDPDGISGGKVLNIFNNGTNGNWDVLRYPLQAGATTEVGVSQRVWLANLPVGDGVGPKIVVYRDVSNNPLAFLSILSSGRIQVSVTGGSNYSTAAPVVSANGWYHIEMSYSLTGSSLISFEVRIEGSTVLSQSNVTGTNSQVGQVAIYGTNQGVTLGPRWYCKDYVIWDGTGSLNNGFLGSVLVTNLLPDADIALNWTPSTGTTGWQILDNIPPSDSQYISAPYNAGGPPFYPDPYKGSLTDLPITATSVKGVITYVRAAKSDGGDGSLQVGLISDPSGTPATVLGADRPITVAQTYWRDVFEVDPKTSAAWLPAAVNDIQIQINRTT